ncbi:hypothetical protein ACIQAL_31540, partial [Pseudomonas sp. NPDC088368]|uniref:hypothetical protein n=1 Tax=Pseudomonas sp. NPDC088368 TaxID=3364453 RepID=UPI003800FA66
APSQTGNASHDLSITPITGTPDTNAAPTVEFTPGAFVEGGAAVSLIKTISIADSDAPGGATPQIGKVVITVSNVQAGDNFGTTLSEAQIKDLGIGYTAVPDGAGKLVITLTGLSGDVSIANYETAIKSITFTESGTDASHLTRGIDITVTDISQNSAPSQTGNASHDLDITPSAPATNVAPTVTFDGAEFKEGGPEVPLIKGLVIADPDGAVDGAGAKHLSAATITLTNMQAGDQLKSTYDDGSGKALGINYSVANDNKGTITISLSGDASIADYEKLINSIQFSETSNDSSLPARGITISVTDIGAAGTTNLSGDHSSTVTVVTNDAPEIKVTANSLDEGKADASTVAGTLDYSDKETSHDKLVVTLSPESAKYYTVSGNDVLLTAAGIAAVNAGTKLPAIEVTVSDGLKSASGNATPTVVTNDAPEIKVTANDLAEGKADATTVAGKLDYSDKETAHDQLTVTLSDASKTYYIISGNDVLLTAAGIAAVNAGTKLPAIEVTVSDGLKSATGNATPTVVTNDAPEIKVTANDLAEGKADATTVAGKLDYSDKETAHDKLTVSLSPESAKYYTVSGNDVLLTAAGIAAVNAGTKLPAIEVTVSDGLKSASGNATPTVVTNDAPEIKVTANDLAEGKADATTVAGKLDYSDKETAHDKLTVSLSPESAKYYTISGNDVLLTAAGIAAVNAGTKLPAIEATVSDGLKSATGNATPTVVTNDAPEIKVTANDLAEGKADATTVAGKLDYSDKETAHDKLTVSLSTESAKYYTISGNDVLLTQTGIDAVNAGTKLPAIEVTVSDGLKSATGNATPTVVTNDAPEIKVTANDLAEGKADATTVAGKLDYSDKETAHDQLTVTLS